MTQLAFQLTSEEVERLDACEGVIRAGLATFYEVGVALLTIRDGRLYRPGPGRPGYPSFETYCRERWGMSSRRANQLVQAAGVQDDVGTMVPKPTNERQARPLAKLPPEQRAEAWQEAVEESNGKPTAAVVAEVVERRMNPEPAPAERPHVISLIKSSESNEWYTPAPYIEAAREVMGGIDLDPASCDEANETVRALTYYTAECSGLEKPWDGRVWLNPPYGRAPNGHSNAALWSAKLLEEFKAGGVESACLLVGANTDTAWFQPLWDYPICFVRGRIQFDGPNAGQSNTQGSAIVYLGPDEELFAQVFSQFGPVVVLWGFV